MKCPECPFCPDIMIIEEQGFLVNTVHSLRSMACFETCNLQSFLTGL
nr:MAG TPA: zinc finger domain protein [Caudoviricetes sp.]